MAQVAVQSSAAVAEHSPIIQSVPLTEVGHITERPAKDRTRSQDAAPKRMTDAERDGILNQLNKTLEAFDTHVSISVDEKSHIQVIKVVDDQTGKVIRQIPNEQMLRISQRITELLGVIYDEKM